MDIGRYDPEEMDSICGREECQAVHPGYQLQRFLQFPRMQIKNFHRARLRATDVSARAEHGRSLFSEVGSASGKPAKGL